MMMTLWDSLSSNPFFSGGAVLMVLGALAAAFRNVPAMIWAWVKARVIVTVTIRNDDEAFVWVAYWLSQQPALRHCRDLTAFSVRGERPFGHDGKQITDGEGRHHSARIRLAPGPGQHLFRYQGRFVYLNRIRDDRAMPVEPGKPREAIELSMLVRNRTVLLDLIEEARRFALPSEDFVEVLVSSYNYWSVAFRQPRRRPETLFLPDGLWSEIETDVRQFLDSKAWRAEHGLPFRRGYLLHGPPGSGKTSLVKVLASHFDLDIAMLCLNRTDLDDVNLLHLMSELKERRSILLLEDIDAIFTDRHRTTDANRSGVTFSGLLNALDGVGTAEQMIIIMTTNHPERLDPALIRPGRADRKFYLGPATPEQARRLYLSIAPEEAGNARKFGELLVNPQASVAELQGMLFRHRLTPTAVFQDDEALAVLRGAEPSAALLTDDRPPRPRPPLPPTALVGDAGLMTTP